ncbi:MAG TPA: DUF418 domain-containing protein [Thermoanaerobaculia bacterium]|nr:DUF418 domain-containing protein [Thermoanaerobaculia bacterium]
MSLRDGTAASPVLPGERLETLDVLRGFALLWIFTFNVFIFSGYEFLGDDEARALATYPLDTTVKFLRHLFIENKDFSLFAFIFGIGFGLMASRADSAGRSVVPLFLRRQGVLLAFGLAHAVFLWGGDILAIYAVLGLCLLPFLRLSPRTILTAAVVVYLLPIPLYALSILIQPPTPYAAAVAWTGEPNLFGIWTEGFTHGGYVEVVKGNLAFLSLWWTMFTLNLYWPDVIGMFLFGLFVSRTRLIERIEADPSLLPGKWVAWAGIAGIAGNIVFAVLTYRGDVYYPPSAAGLVLTLVQYTAVPLLCFFYMAGLAWLSQRPAWRRRFKPLVAVGRMTLTNYLMQSLLCMFIFYGIGLGLYGKIGAAPAVAVAWVIYTLQVLFSRWWWSRGFAFGPAEWLWRRLSYGGAPSLKASRLSDAS